MKVDPVPVTIVRTKEELTSLAPEFGGCSNWFAPVIGSAQPVQILQRRPTRTKAIIRIDSLGGGLTTIEPANPGVGVATFTQVLASPAQLVSVKYTLTTDAVVGNRFLNINILDPTGNQIAQASDTGAIPASTTATGWFSLGIGADASFVSGNAFEPIPALGTLPTGYQVQIRVSGMDAGDQISGIVITLQQAGGSVVLAHRADYLANPSNPQGFIIAAAPAIFQWENQQPCYAVALGGSVVTISTIDQAQAGAQAEAEESVQSRGYDDEANQQEGVYAGSDAGNEY